MTGTSGIRPRIRTAAKRFLQAEFDVRRVDRVRREYDRDSGYGEFHAACRRAFRRPESDAVSPLAEAGFFRLQSMAAAAAAEFVAEVRTRFPSLPFRNNAERVHAYAIDDDAFTLRLLSAALSPEVDGEIARFLRSEYLVHWYVVTRAEARPEENYNSFLWHCDRGPGAHLKLLVYLNGFEAHGGSTEFLDLATTRAMERSGYLFGAVADRRADLTSLAEQVGSEFRPQALALEAGEGLLFQPRNVLHRGRMPSHADRYMLSICLLPSPLPWRQAFDRGVMSDLARDPKWHGNAMDVFRILESAGR